jgi:hypothetical protein
MPVLHFAYSGPLVIAGREAASGQAREQFSLRQAKYLPVPPGGVGIGLGTKRRMSGSRKNRWPRLKFSAGGKRRNPSTSGLLSTKSLPRTITGTVGFGLIKPDFQLK